MKATLLLLLCLTGMSVQQSPFWSFLPHAPFQYFPQLANRKADQVLEPVATEAKDAAQIRYKAEPDFPVRSYDPFHRFYDYGYQPVNQAYHDQEARVKGSSDVESRLSNQNPTARFFLPWPFGFGFGTGSFGTGISPTVYSFVSTMITSTSIKFCTEAAAFSNVISCRRRRETLFKLLADRELVEPSPADQVEVTALSKTEEVPVARAVEESADPVITSSLETLDPSPRKGRSFFTTLTVTTLASSISTTTVTSTVRASAILASSTKLLCVPAGATVC